DLWPNREFSLTVVVTTPKFLAEHPDIVRKVLQRHRALTARLQKDPKSQAAALNEALATLTGKSLPPAVLGEALARVKFTDEPLADTLTTMGQWSYDLEFIQRPPKLDKLVDISILQSLQASGG